MYTPDLIFLTVLFWCLTSIWSWEESPRSNDRITVNVIRRISPHMKIAIIFLSWTLSIWNDGLFKIKLEFSFSFPGFSFSALDLVFQSGFQTWDSLHTSIPVLTYFSAIADCSSLVFYKTKQSNLELRFSNPGLKQTWNREADFQVYFKRSHKRSR